MSEKKDKQFEYDIAISFAGEDRKYASKIAETLRASNVRVFYDEFETEALWGKDLYEHLDDVYRKQARFCIMLLSKDYAKKAWTNHERKSAQGRAFQKNEEYILPVKLDDTEIPGILPTMGYLDGRDMSPSDVARAAIRKLNDTFSIEMKATNKTNAPTRNGMGRAIPIPKIRQEFTDSGKDDFVQGSFNDIAAYFEEGIQQLQASDPDLKADFSSIDSQKFTATIYLRGTTKNKCKIWMANNWSSRSIGYAEQDFRPEDDNHWNDSLSVVEDENELRLRAMMRPLFIAPAIDTDRMDRQTAAEYLWRRFIKCLEY